MVKIAEEVDVSTFGFFQRNSVGEFIRFTHTVVLGKLLVQLAIGLGEGCKTSLIFIEFHAHCNSFVVNCDFRANTE